MQRVRLFGPGSFVAAAFIGPGTLTVCTLAGVRLGYELVWVLFFATFATIVLQGMAARLGSVTGQGLGEALRTQIKHPLLKVVGLGTVFLAIIVGNAAYEMGNITGALLGFESHKTLLTIVLGLGIGLLIWIHNLSFLQKLLAIVVLVMSLIFITTALVVVTPDDLIRGLRPRLSNENQLTALALVGTTIVPYNLFLHASVCSQTGINNLPRLKMDTLITISLGGLISLCVLITATSATTEAVTGISDLSGQLEPLLGKAARPFLTIGIFAAGVSSALTAPLAASMTAKGIFGWSNSRHGKWVALFVLVSGMVFSLFNYQPITMIQLAQVANGLLLPVVVLFLVSMSNKKSLMGQHTNTPFQNLLAAFVIIISLLVALRGFHSVFDFL